MELIKNKLIKDVVFSLMELLGIFSYITFTLFTIMIVIYVMVLAGIPTFILRIVPLVGCGTMIYHFMIDNRYRLKGGKKR